MEGSKRLFSALFVLMLLLVATVMSCEQLMKVFSHGKGVLAKLFSHHELFMNQRERWGQEWQKQGLVNHRAIGSRGYASERATVPLFAKQRGFMEANAEASADDAFAPNIVKSIYEVM